MLVLQRKVGERILIDNSIEIVILSIQGGRAKLGLSAPLDIQISRAESLDRQTAGVYDGRPVPRRNPAS